MDTFKDESIIGQDQVVIRGVDSDAQAEGYSLKVLCEGADAVEIVIDEDELDIALTNLGYTVYKDFGDDDMDEPLGKACELLSANLAHSG